MRFEPGRNLERELSRVADKAMRGVAHDYQKALDSIARRYVGKPPSLIKPVLKREWAKLGGQLSEPELTKYATHISEGTRIKFRVQK